MPIFIKYASIVIPETLSPARRKIGSSRQPAVNAEEGKATTTQEATIPLKFPVKKLQFPEINLLFIKFEKVDSSTNLKFVKNSKNDMCYASCHDLSFWKIPAEVETKYLRANITTQFPPT